MAKDFSRRIQSDERVRVVTLANLEAMCDYVSGNYCHKFWIEKASPTSVKVGYSNEDEYANEHPMYAYFPAYIDNSFHEHTLYVVLGHMISVIHDNWNGEGWQAFTPLTDCEKLWRSNLDTDDWKTREEIAK